MPTFANWRNHDHASDTAAQRAAAAWERINDKATSITLYRGSAAQSAQTVRLEWLNMPIERTGATGDATITRLVIFGVADHPSDSVADTNIQAEDRFQVGGVNYRVVEVVTYPGEIQAYTERIK